MPPKRKAKASAAAPPKKKQPKPDWRMPLFYWRGEWTEYVGRHGKTWSGTWVASEEGLPTSDEFAESVNTFKLTAQGDSLSGALSGTYKLDNGDGPQDYSDIRHMVHSLQVRAPSAGAPFHVVGARGTTEFGEFLSMGVLCGSTLTLARRYIDDKDARKKLSAEEVVEGHCSALVAASGTCRYEAEDFLAKLHNDVLPWKWDGPLAPEVPEPAAAASGAPPPAVVASSSAPVPATAAAAATNPHVAFFRGPPSATNPHMAASLGWAVVPLSAMRAPSSS